MSNTEHLIENMLTSIEKGKTREDIMNDKTNIGNATEISMDIAWEISQYVYYSYIKNC